jgi:hypothetical protein
MNHYQYLLKRNRKSLGEFRKSEENIGKKIMKKNNPFERFMRLSWVLIGALSLTPWSLRASRGDSGGDAD